TENMIWKVELPGIGNSSPIVWGKYLFLHSADKDGKQRSLLCLDAADGKIRWQKSIPAGPAKIRADSSLASSTPTTDGRAVYVSFWDGKDILVSAYDFHGNALCTKATQVQRRLFLNWKCQRVWRPPPTWDTTDCWVATRCGV